jgi:Tol biopolymer transport system component
MVVASGGWCVDPVFSPDSRFIAYSSNVSGSFDIWLVDVNGRNNIRLTSLEGDERKPQFSPDGRWIAFLHVDGGGQDIFLFDMLTLNLLRLTENSAPKNVFEWSPKDVLLVYDMLYNGRWSVWVTAIGGEFNWLVGDEAYDPAWSNSGRSIVYVRKDMEKYTLIVYDMSTHNTKHVYSTSHVIRRPKFSNNDTRIIFLQSLNDSWGIYAYNLLTGEVNNLLEAPPGGLMTPHWKPIVTEDSIIHPRPNTGEILFNGYSTKDTADLFLIVENAPIFERFFGFWGTRIERLTHGYKRIIDVTWSVDGSKLVFAAVDYQMFSKIVLQQYVKVEVVSIYRR